MGNIFNKNNVSGTLIDRLEIILFDLKNTSEIFENRKKELGYDGIRHQDFEEVSDELKELEIKIDYEIKHQKSLTKTIS